LKEFGGYRKMKKTRIVISLIIIACVVFMLGAMSVYADTPTTITTITTNSGNNTANKATNITSDGTTNKTTNAANKVNTITPIGTTNNTANRVSSYTNNTSTTSQDGLPYTGTNYSIVFIIAALAISAVYAYKKVTDYNV